MDKILTIVIPVFKTEQYLRKCLDSLIVENIADRIEVIIIIDGSPDNSISIAREYVERLPETFRLIDKENGGHGSCCNVGLQAATGKYIRFLDSDDWFDEADFPKFINLLCSIDVDLIQCNRVLELAYKNITVQEDYYSKISNKIWDAKSFPYEVLEYPNLIHNSTFKTESLKLSGIHFKEKMSFYDKAHYILPYKTVNTIYCSDLHVYHYFIGREGQSVSGIDLTKMKFREHEFRKLTHDYLSIRECVSACQRQYFDGFMNSVIYLEYFRYAFLLQKSQSLHLIIGFSKFLRGVCFVPQYKLSLLRILCKIPYPLLKNIFILFYKTNRKLLKINRDKINKSIKQQVK